MACEAAAAALACPDRISVAAVARVNDTMAKHLIRCPHAGEDAKAEARDADDDLDAPDGKKLNFPAGKVQSTLAQGSHDGHALLSLRSSEALSNAF